MSSDTRAQPHKTRSRRVGVDFDRPFACTVAHCRKAFTRSEHLRRHQLNHRSKPASTCAICPATFVRADLWRRHLRVTHGRSPPAYDASVEDVSPPMRVVPSTCDLKPHPERPSDAILSREAANFGGSSSPRPLLSECPPVAAEYDFDLDIRHTSLTSITDLAWLTDGHLLDSADEGAFQSITSDQTWENDDFAPPGLHDDFHACKPSASCSEPALASRTETSEPLAPDCGFRVCNALTEERRATLLTCLKDEIPDLDMTSPVFSLNNMKMGVHLYAKYVSKQSPIFHHQILAPITEGDRSDVDNYCGGEAPYQLSWAIITLGWSLWDFHGGQDVQMAVKIHKVLRPSIINHRAFTLDPPIWIVQTLFLVLVFARYCGDSEDHGASVIFHGVLVDAVRRLDRRGRAHYIPDLRSEKPSRHEWFKWIHVETMKRLVFHTFILDVQHVILHGGDMCMSPFELNLQLPHSEAAWATDSVDTWAAALRKTSTEPPQFLTMLKQFWNASSTAHRLPQAYPGDSTVILYGIMSIACDMKRRDDHTFSARPKDSLSALNGKLLKSFESWVSWWDRNREPLGLEIFVWRNCSCMLRLAYTLYEIGPVELQAAGGRDVVEGKHIGMAEYARAKRKIRAWAREERALLAVSKAASILHSRLSTTYVSSAHCYQCNWALYLASLVCWNFTYVLTGGINSKSSNDNYSASAAVPTTSSNPRPPTPPASPTYSHVRATSNTTNECLQSLLDLPCGGVTEEVMQNISTGITDVLLVLIDVLSADASGLITESVKSLKRLVL